jgi:structural maintenance of chromosomes protein 5
MQDRNDDLEREVERFHQRREIEQHVSWGFSIISHKHIVMGIADMATRW